MTNEEAIKEIQRWVYGCPYGNVKEAFELAIKALERDGTIPFEDDEPTVCTCPVCGSIWKTAETNKSGTWN